MTEEIKEILQDVIDDIYQCGEYIGQAKKLEKVLNYITNLQKEYGKIYNENCKLREQHNITDINLLDENYRLQKENEKLKEENKRIFSRVNDDELLISNAMNYAELQDYKSRNEKAVEYIRKNRIVNTIFQKNEDELINILQGGDE